MLITVSNAKSNKSHGKISSLGVNTRCTFLKMTLAVMLRADFRKAEEEENLSSYCNNLGEE